MEKWYVVDDGGVYNVFPESDLKQYGIERDHIVKVTTNMDMAFNYAEKLNRDTEEKSPNFAPSKGYYNESKQNNSKVFLTESRLNQIISESIKRAILKEGFFDSFPSMYEKEEKKDDDSSKEKGENQASAKRRERVISRLKSDGVDVAQYAYRLWPDKDEDSARSYFYKCLDSKTNDTGDVYKFTSDEINRLYSMLSNDEEGVAYVTTPYGEQEKLSDYMRY